MNRNQLAVETGLSRIASKARQNANCRFSSLAHHITPNLLSACLLNINKRSAAGVDGQSVEQARSDFVNWSSEQLNQVHRKGYRPPPVRRVYIPKPGKKEMRPIGVPCIQDRVLQRATAKVLEQVYEQDFAPFSFGGRPKMSAHGAVSTLKHTISSKKISWVYEADIKGFFCSLNHGWLMRFVEHRIADPRILTLIRRWLKAGVLEQSDLIKVAQGTPQGGSISVLMSNIYMHYVLDIWFDKVVKPRLKGEAYLVRYIDDFVVCFQFKGDADRFVKALHSRLGKFDLQLEPSKTRLIQFGRFTVRDCKLSGKRAKTFDFLGFTFYHLHSTKGNYLVGLKTTKKKLNMSMLILKAKLRKYRHQPLAFQVKVINAHLRGHYQYFGVPLNSRSLRKLYRYAIKSWRKALSSRSHSGRINWTKYNAILKYYPLESVKLRYSQPSFRAVGLVM